MSTTKPEALRLADEYAEASFDQGLHKRKLDDAPENARSALEAELRRMNQSEREGWRHASELEQERKRLHAEIADLEAQLEAIGAGYTAADMATAAAQGFRDGVASAAPLMGAAGYETQLTMAVRMLVAADHVTQAKVDEAMALAARFLPPPSKATGAAGDAGWVMVPVDPTPEMCAVASIDEGARITDGPVFAAYLYSAMLAASPPAPSSAKGVAHG